MNAPKAATAALPVPRQRGDDTTFSKAVADFAEMYADVNERDHRAVVEAVRSGRLAAEADA